jgi:hypothetical protein
MTQPAEGDSAGFVVSGENVFNRVVDNGIGIAYRRNQPNG